MPNYIWFFLLIILAAILFIYTLTKKDKAKVFSLYFFISGLAYIFDYIVFVLGDAYSYHPNFFKVEWFDYFYGSSVSQAMAVPMVAIFLASFNLSLLWYFLFAFMFIVIEWLFVRFDLYVQNWWHYSFTFLFMLSSFFSTLKWQTMLNRPKKFVLFWTMCLCIVFIDQTVSFYRVALFHTNLYSPGWFSDPIRDHLAGNFIVTFVASIFVTIAIVNRIRWYGYVFLLASNYFVDMALIHSGYLQIAPFWNLFYSILLSAIMIVLYRWIYNKLFFTQEHFRK